MSRAIRALGRARRFAQFWKVLRAQVVCELEEKDSRGWATRKGDKVEGDDPPCWRHRVTSESMDFYGDYHQEWGTREPEDWCAPCKRRQRMHESAVKWRRRATARLAAATRSVPPKLRDRHYADPWPDSAWPDGVVAEASA